MLENGGFQVKMGQMMCTMGACPSFIKREMQPCLTSTRAAPFDEVRRVVVERLGVARLSEVFAWVEMAPLASASVAQVHRATLKDGADVVVKVQHEGVADGVPRPRRLSRDVGWENNGEIVTVMLGRSRRRCARTSRSCPCSRRS